MSSVRLFRPLAQALRPAAIRTGIFTRTFSAKSGLPQTQAAAATEPSKKMNVVYAAMPQLVPFYFVNEVSVAFVIIPSLIYLFSKYVLPQKVRLMCARLFISKL